MKNPVGSLLILLTVMVSVMAGYINLGCMLYGSPPQMVNTAASATYLLAWAGLAVYSSYNHGRYSFFISIWWFPALIGAALCVVTISGMTRVLEYAAYLLLFLLSPLFGLRLYDMSHMAWAMVMSAICLCYAATAIHASAKRPGAPEPPADGDDMEAAETAAAEAAATVEAEPTPEAEAAEPEASAAEAESTVPEATAATEAEPAEVAEAATAPAEAATAPVDTPAVPMPAEPQPVAAPAPEAASATDEATGAEPERRQPALFPDPWLAQPNAGEAPPME